MSMDEQLLSLSVKDDQAQDSQWWQKAAQKANDLLGFAYTDEDSIKAILKDVEPHAVSPFHAGHMVADRARQKAVAWARKYDVDILTDQLDFFTSSSVGAQYFKLHAQVLGFPYIEIRHSAGEGTSNPSKQLDCVATRYDVDEDGCQVLPGTRYEWVGSVSPPVGWDDSWAYGVCMVDEKNHTKDRCMMGTFDDAIDYLYSKLFCMESRGWEVKIGLMVGKDESLPCIAQYHQGSRKSTGIAFRIEQLPVKPISDEPEGPTVYDEAPHQMLNVSRASHWLECTECHREFDEKSTASQAAYGIYGLECICPECLENQYFTCTHCGYAHSVDDMIHEARWADASEFMRHPLHLVGICYMGWHEAPVEHLQKYFPSQYAAQQEENAKLLAQSKQLEQEAEQAAMPHIDWGQGMYIWQHGGNPDRECPGQYCLCSGDYAVHFGTMLEVYAFAEDFMDAFSGAHNGHWEHDSITFDASAHHVDRYHWEPCSRGPGEPFLHFTLSVMPVHDAMGAAPKPPADKCKCCSRELPEDHLSDYCASCWAVMEMQLLLDQEIDEMEEAHEGRNGDEDAH